MKIKLLLLLIAGIILLPTGNAQLLTVIEDTTKQEEIYKSKYYGAAGYSGRVVLGYEQMRNFYQKQGFDHLRAQEFITFGTGLRLGERFYVDLCMDGAFSDNNPLDVELQNGNILSLQERKVALHLLLGYRFWQKRYKSLIIHTGASWLQNKGAITERHPGNFDFNAVNTGDVPVVRSWPIFIHRQAALHFALQLRLNYPRPRWWSTELDLKIGFVSGLRAKPWTIDPGQALNVLTDKAQYLYVSSVYYFFSRQK